MEFNEITYEGSFEVELNVPGLGQKLLEIQASYRGYEVETEEARDVPNYFFTKDEHFYFTAEYWDEDLEEMRPLAKKTLKNISNKIYDEVISRAPYN